MTIKTLPANSKQNKEEKNSGENPNQNINVVVNSNVRAPHRNVLGHQIGTQENQSPQREKRNLNGSLAYEEANVRHRTPSKSKGKRDAHNKRDRDRDKANKDQIFQVVVGSNQKAKDSGVVCTINNVNNVNNLLEETFSDYNSGDEHIEQRDAILTLEEWTIRDKTFIKAISDRGLVVKEIIEDGACLFRAISLQIYGDQDMHEVIRQQTMDYIFQNREYFAQFVTEDITNYISRKRQNNVHGNHIEIQAMSEIYNRPVELYCYEKDPINIFNSEQKNNGYEPLRLSYQRCSHYNAILNPYKASVGVGLGLAGYRPEDFSEHKQFKDAVQLSEEQEIEQTMFEDKLKTTDWEATNEAIEEQIARESYIQWCREQTNFRSSTSSSTVTSTAVSTPNTSSQTSHASTNIINNINNTNTNNNVNNTCNNNNHSLNGSSSSDSNSIKNHLDYDEVDDDNGDQRKRNEQCDENKNEHLSSSGSSSTSCSSSNNNINNNNNLNNNNNNINNNNNNNNNINNNNTENSYRRKFREHFLKNCVENSNDVTTATTLTTGTSVGINKRRRRRPSDNLSPLNVLPIKKRKNLKHFIENNNNFPNLEVTASGPSTSRASDEVNKDEPALSIFYQSLLESSYTDDGVGQLSEHEMLQKALQMSRIDYIKKSEKQRTSFIDEEYDSSP